MVAPQPAGSDRSVNHEVTAERAPLDLQGVRRGIPFQAPMQMTNANITAAHARRLKLAANLRSCSLTRNSLPRAQRTI